VRSSAPPATRTRTGDALARRYGFVIAAFCLVTIQVVIGPRSPFPTNWNINLSDPVDDAQSWVRDNRNHHWLFDFILNPVADSFEWGLERVENLVLWLPWYVLPVLVFWCIARNGRWIVATITSLVALYPAAVGLREPTAETIALMAIAVVVSVAIGFAAGVSAALNPRFERTVRPILDAMQVVPATVYLIPFTLLFGIGPVPAALSTAIYAIPPMVRLTTLGLQQVPSTTVEAARMFGSSRLQTLTKVQLPQAVPSIVTGINQTINMALGIVVLAALIGAGGLGQEVIATIRIRRPGRGFVAGFAVVAIAIVFDRVARAFVERSQQRGRTHRATRSVAILGAIAVATAVGRNRHWVEIPLHWDSTFADPIDDLIRWIRDNWGGVLRSFNDFVVRDVWKRTTDWLTTSVAWPVFVCGAVILGWKLKNWRLATFAGCAVSTIGLVGLWAASIDTLVQSLIALSVGLVVALPVGIVAGTRPRIERALSPIADTLQTLPSLIYAIPFVMIFTVGVVPGILASVLYAIPVGVKLTALGIREVPESTIEAARSFGATSQQILWRVRVPLALPSIVLAINQMIMMVLANIIIAGLIGGGALGFQAINALTKEGTGLGFEVGVAIVAMALVLDRLMHAVAERIVAPSTPV
jgi:glycine betaine/proline transport system permease protein